MHKVGILHYSAPPVIGGVESIMYTHARLFVEAEYPTAILAGRGSQQSLPAGVDWIGIPELDSKHPQILEISRALEGGEVPPGFEPMVAYLTGALFSHLNDLDMLIVHNVFTKHFNLPLTAALFRLLDQQKIRHCVAWCHDITWTSPHSRSKVHQGYPWDLLRTFRSDITYVAISYGRQQELAGLLGCSPQTIRVIYNGVDQDELLALSAPGLALMKRLDLWESDLNLLLPVRITQAKNIELAMRVVAALKKKNVNPRLVISGPPDPHDQKNVEYFQNLLNLRAELGVEEEVRFVYQSGPDPSAPYIVEMSLVAELFRVSDALLMPSHREGFGLPVLEAGLAGLPVFSADTIPSAREIAAKYITQFPPDMAPEPLADLILNSLNKNPIYHLRKNVRQSFSWHGIFAHDIVPLLDVPLLDQGWS